MGFPRMRAGVMRKTGELPACTGISYGDYFGTKSIYNDGVNNFLRNADFSYDNSVTGFTILSMWYLDTSVFVDLGFLLSIKQSQGDLDGYIGNNYLRSYTPTGVNSFNYFNIPTSLTPFYLAQSYNPVTDDFIYSADGSTKFNLNYPSNTYPNWNGGSNEYYVFRRNGGSNRAPGYCGFMQVIDQPLSEICCNNWTGNKQPRNIVGSFNDLLLADFESGVVNNGTNDVIQDLSANSYDLILDGFTANQKNPAHADYCIKNIP